MKRILLFTALLVFTACMTSTASTPATMATAAPGEDVGAAINGLAEEFDSQMRAGNIDGFMALYADDAILMPPNSPPMNGSGAIRRFWSALLAAGKTDVNLMVDDVQSCGDIAVERGRYELTAPFKDNGKYIVIWRKRGEKWQIANDIFNSNLPPPQ